MAKIQKITPFLWFENQAEEAANFYTSIFKNSKINRVARPNGTVSVVNFTIDGVEFSALNGGPKYRFSEAISFVVQCSNQNEVDYFWDKLTADGGSESQCAWLKDKYGVSWQIVPTALIKLLNDPNPEVASRAMQNMLGMKKIVIKDLKRIPKKVKLRVKTLIKAPVEQVWEKFTKAADIQAWNFASPDWHCPKAANDLRVGGAFSYTMAAKDGSFSFDFGGQYDAVVPHQHIAYTLEDYRKVEVFFKKKGKNTEVIEVFEAENMNSVELQQAGWQAILDNFKNYTEKF